MPFHPYLFFDGTCREAFTRYHEIFGGDLQLLSMADMAANEGEPPPAEQGELIMHAALIAADALLMGSDDPTGGFDSVQGMQVNYDATDVADANRVFNALSEDGEATMPLTQTSWSPAFGMLRDRFGTPWMISTAAP
jgi:PhnB protein